MMDYQIEFLKLLEGMRTDFLIRLFEGITMLAEETLMIFAVVTLWFAVDKRIAQKLFFVTAFSLGVNGIIKNFVKMPRPFADGKVSCVREHTATGYSFPSGHTQNFATWSTLIALKTKKILVWIVTISLILLVAFSRMFLGAHYPMDVIAGALLGVLFATVGNAIYEKTENKKNLYIWTVIIFAPFIAWFMFFPNPLYADFFKIYGMIAGTCLGINFEERYAPLRYDIPLFKKVIRVVLGIIIALLFKSGLKMLFATEIVRLGLVFDAVRYFVLLFIMVGLCPLMFKKMRI